MSASVAARSFSVGRARLWVGVVALVISVAYGVETMGLPIGSLKKPGAAIFPLICTGLMVVASLVTIWDALTTLRREDEREAIPSRDAFCKMALLIGALLFYALTLRYLGRVIGTYLVVAVLVAVFFEGRRSIWPLVHAAWITFSIWLLFIYTFGLPLPRGALINL